MRTEGDFIKINEWLIPLSWIYGAVVRFRNQLFDMELLHQKAYDIPIISVGNITVGGAGKTPHVEYLIRLLKGKLKVAVLSRGYKRRTRGFVLADTDTAMREIGDEPFQMKSKFPDIYVAVDGNRCRGVEKLTGSEATKDVDVILLDDAYQHRYIKPGINILLVDYHRLILYDKLLPAGRLREPIKGKNRADIVIITKCPEDLKPMEYRVLTKAMNLYPYQELFFTTLEYGPLQPIFKDCCQPLAADEPANSPFQQVKNENILLLTGIASPEQLVKDFSEHGIRCTTLSFPDHHLFKQKDIERINSTFASMPLPKRIITTEKDESRIVSVEGFSQEVKQSLYSLPIHIKFMLEEEENFNNKIISYVRKNSRNSILAKRKDDHKARNSHHSGNRSGTISFRNN